MIDAVPATLTPQPGRCPPHRHWRQQFALAAALLMQASLLSALPTDRDQPIEIEAQRAMRDDKQGLSVYEGAVTVVQGTSKISADKVSLHSRGNKITLIRCEGKPARFQQTSNPEDGPLRAQARTLEYHLDTDIITLINDASLEQQGSTLRGERIRYDLTNRRVEAQGDEAGKQRVHILIPAERAKGGE